MVNDSIADMLTRIRNGLVRRHDTVVFPASKLKQGVLEVLKNKGLIESYEVLDSDKSGKNASKKDISVTLKYNHGKPAITNLKRVSKPGRRVYTDYLHIPVVRNNYGFMVISTSKGIKDTFTARKEKLGGEVICEVF